MLRRPVESADLMVACDEERHAPYSGFILIGYAFIAWAYRLDLPPHSFQCT